ncbi:hypothetical protein O0880_23725 [Janthinobacterium sp. SUN118]|uniref:hypothetical protein n=1 Tax=Janthinobacterium sp. SUN118 TaxID=3004100 RepID=UPI0025B25205|nr:hypothetical protein [Janthinobacterium sp. SUN118]MDN2712431.1 hypothetical protein [Janthinobacterium sp. SUN118]
MSRRMTVARFSLVVLAAGALFLPLARYAWSVNAAQVPPAMQASVTYPHLLRKTPFFTQLTAAQLRTVIAQSHEWEVRAGTVIASSGDADGAIWILLDGGWQVEAGGKIHPALHDGAGKWYGGDAVRGTALASRLVANRHSYVLRIAAADFARMREQGYDFDAHVRQGEQYYGQLLRQID